jgi:hypothetical protein
MTMRLNLNLAAHFRVLLTELTSSEVPNYSAE